MPQVGRRRALVIIVVLLWTTGVGFGLAELWSYENATGEAAGAPVRWPADSRIPPPADVPVLVMLLHPQCPCSRASVAELARLMAHAQGRVSAHALMVAPAGIADEWVQSDLWRAAAAIPGVRVAHDADGVEAHRFGAVVSGPALLYDEDGTLQFSGGITGSRGHEGDNAGRTAIESLLAGHASDRASTFVFGCLLFAADGSAGLPDVRPS